MAGWELGSSILDDGLFGRDIYFGNKLLKKKKKELILASGSGKCIACNWLSLRYPLSVFIFWIPCKVTGGCWGQDEVNVVRCRALHCPGSEMTVTDQSRAFSWVRGIDTAPLVSFCYVCCTACEWVRKIRRIQNKHISWRLQLLNVQQHPRAQWTPNQRFSFIFPSLCLPFLLVPITDIPK